MNLPSYVKPHPLWWKFFPFLKNYSGNTIYPKIYLRQDIYEGLLKNKGFPRGLSILKHEEYHRQQHKKIGIIRYRLYYLFSPEFRFEQELEAYKVTMRILKKHNLPFDIEKIAHCLSGWMYLWSISYEEAEKRLRAVWEDPETHSAISGS